MARPSSLPCRSCEGMLTVVRETREDPDHPTGPVIWRLRECRDCGARSAGVEQLVSLVEAERRLAELARERMTLHRAGRRDPEAVGV
jgi:transcriptional regulator NrdR family protein